VQAGQVIHTEIHKQNVGSHDDGHEGDAFVFPLPLTSRSWGMAASARAIDKLRFTADLWHSRLAELGEQDAAMSVVRCLDASSHHYIALPSHRSPATAIFSACDRI
jgi:hypothetical protein